MKTRMMLMAMMLVMLTAGVAVADNTNIDTSNEGTFTQTTTANPNATATVSGVEAFAGGGTGVGIGGAGIVDHSGNSENNIKVNADASMKDSGNVTGSGISNQKTQNQNVYINKGNLPTVGFNGFMSPGKADSGNWEILCKEMYMDWAADDVEEASYKKGFFDIITFDWGINYEFTSMRKALPPNTKPTSCLDYWPGWDSLEGDRPLGAIDIVGKVNTPDAAFVAQAYDVCKKEKGSSWVAIIKEDIKEDVTSGASLNLSGALSKITGGGESGTAVASGIGFAKARVKKENSIVVKAL
ncbi:MAG: hypothetical protein PHP62_05265 [Candidatus Moranbacteria bacterium]|nr:hypothetical protein [Candidatus Moranbacteria bacterium]